jgi:hypothetical protein
LKVEALSASMPTFRTRDSQQGSFALGLRSLDECQAGKQDSKRKRGRLVVMK